MKFGIKYTFDPTPHKMRVAGDLMLAFLGTAGISAIVSNHPTIGAVISGVGYFLKLAANFSAESDK
jgi:hypothetical protein